MEEKLLDENGCNGFELQQYKYVREFSGGLFSYFLLIGRCVSCVSDGSRIHANIARV